MNTDYSVTGVNREVNLARLDKIAAYERDWNGCGAEPFSVETIEAAKKALAECTIEPEIFPCASGWIQFEWEQEGKYYVELKVTGDNFWEVWSKDNCFPAGAKVRANAYGIHTVERYIKNFED